MARVGLLAALAAAAGYADPIPNVEMISVVLFLAGAHLGVRGGVLVTIIARGLHSVVNPWGPAPPVVIVGNIAGSMVMGIAGALTGPVLARRFSVPPRAAALALVGAVLTLAHDLITNFATVVTMGALANPLPVFVAGVPFALVHIASNAAVFAVVGTPLVARLARAPRAA
ncbi:MAG: hypothetical protein ACKVU1_12280, partial [bacterium]